MLILLGAISEDSSQAKVYEGRGRSSLVPFTLECSRVGAHPSKLRRMNGLDLQPDQADLTFIVIRDTISATDQVGCLGTDRRLLHVLTDGL